MPVQLARPAVYFHLVKPNLDPSVELTSSQNKITVGSRTEMQKDHIDWPQLIVCSLQDAEFKQCSSENTWDIHVKSIYET